MRKPLPPLDTIKPDTPLRLAVAAAIAFPDGSITENSLRRAANDGELGHEILRAKYHTTLSAIADWRALCRVQPKGRGSGSARKGATPTARSERALGEYLASKYKPNRGRKRHPDQIFVADVLAIYLTDAAPLRAREAEIK